MAIAIFTLLFCIFLFFGLFVFFINSRQVTNRLFSIISIFYALIAINGLLIQLPNLIQYRLIFFLFGATLYILNLYLILVFNALLTKAANYLWIIIGILLFPTLYSFVRLGNIPLSDFNFFDKSGITYVKEFTGELSALNTHVSSINLINLFMSVGVLIIGYKNAHSIKLKKQIITISIALVVSILIAFIDYAILFQYFNTPETRRIPGLLISYNLFWLLGILVALHKYRFLAVNPSMINQEILSNIDESILLMNTNYRIVLVNKKLKELLQLKNLKGEYISRVIHEYKHICLEMNKLKPEHYSNFSCRCNFLISSGDYVLMECKCKIVSDKFGDTVGFLIIANRVKEVKQFRDLYSISSRELQVIQLVIEGKTNKEIARDLEITERTIKTHLTNIFIKLAVDNKLKLIMLLKDYNLISETQSEKTVLIKA